MSVVLLCLHAERGLPRLVLPSRGLALELLAHILGMLYDAC